MHGMPSPGSGAEREVGDDSGDGFIEPTTPGAQEQDMRKETVRACSQKEDLMILSKYEYMSQGSGKIVPHMRERSESSERKKKELSHSLLI